MATIWQDLKYATRILARSPAFTVVAVLSLALGIGAVTSVYTIISAVLIHTVPYADPERIVSVRNTHLRHEGWSSVSYPQFLDWQEQSDVFEQLTVVSDGSLDLSGPEGPQWVGCGYVTSSFFPLMRHRPILGRNFRAEEDEVGNGNVVILGHDLWMNRFGGRENIVGDGILLNEESYTVVGVMGPDFRFLEANAEIWVPASSRDAATNRGNHWLEAVGRLKQDVSYTHAQAQMVEIAHGLAEVYPKQYTDRSVEIHSLGQEVTDDVQAPFVILFGCVIFVLLISCVNVANLLLARVAARQREVTVRVALGASRGRLIRQLLTESALLAMLGGAVGLLFSKWGIDFIVSLMPEEESQFYVDYFGIGLNAEVILVALLVTLGTTFLFGLVPALRASNPDLNQALKEGGASSGAGKNRHRLLQSLVVSEVVLALILLVSAGLMARSFQQLSKVDPGIDTENLLTVSLNASDKSYPTGEQKAAFFRQLEERVAGLGGVERVGSTAMLPLSGSNANNTIAIEGRPDPGPGRYEVADIRVITPGYPEAIGVPLLRGRGFTDFDNNPAAPVTLINASMAEWYWPGEDALGKRFKRGLPDSDVPWLEVVGVLGNVRHREFAQEPQPAFFMPHAQERWPRMILVIRTKSDPAILTSSIRTIVNELNPNMPLRKVITMEDIVHRVLWGPRFIASLFTALAVVALLLAVVGIYGVISYSVSQRTHEIGVRMALGAQAADVRRLIVFQGFKLGLYGVLIGLPLSLALARVMKSLVYGIGTGDPVTFAAVSLLLLVVVVAASYLPTRRATQVNPAIALRHD